MIEAARGVRLAGFLPRDEDASFKALQDRVLDYFASRAHRRVRVEEVARGLGLEHREVRAAISALIGRGLLVRLEEDRSLDTGAIGEIRAVVAAELRRRGRLRIADLTAVLGLSRSAVIPLMEYFDAVGFTRRVGHYRELGNGQAAEGPHA